MTNNAINDFFFSTVTGIYTKNNKFINAYVNNAGTGDIDIYTVPAGKQAFVQKVFAHNPSSSITGIIQINVSGTYRKISTPQAISTNATNDFFALNGAPYCMSAGDILSINTSATGLNVYAKVVEFDASSYIVPSLLTSFINGDNTLYTVTSGKTGLLFCVSSCLMPPNAGTASTNNIGYTNNTGGNVTVVPHIVPFGGSPGSTNQIGQSRVIATTGYATSIFTYGFVSMNSGDFISLNTSVNTAGQVAWCTAIEV